MNSRFFSEVAGAEERGGKCVKHKEYKCQVFA